MSGLSQNAWEETSVVELCGGKKAAKTERPLVRKMIVVTIATTRDKVEALQRHLANQFLGHTKDEELVRELLADLARALAPRR